MATVTSGSNGVPKAYFSIRYEKNEITSILSNYLITLTYTDYLSGQSDSLEIELENVDGRWMNEWYPGHGDRLSLAIGWLDDEPRDIGHFEIDEIEFRSPPSTVTIRALAAGINASVRTRETLAYEKTTLDAVANTVAQRQGLTLVGSIEPIALDRVTQQASDIEFLAQLADEYDYAFKITGSRLVFHAISELMVASPVATINVTELSDYRVRDQIKQLPKQAEVRSQNSATSKLTVYQFDNEGEIIPKASSVKKKTTSADIRKISSRSPSPEVAEAKARADIARANRERTTGAASLMGRPMLLSGNVFTLLASGLLNGDYLILSSSHRFDHSGGYITEVEYARVRSYEPDSSSGSKPKKKLTVYKVSD
ncbi:hypothetical protein YP72344_02260 [Yersinia pseudotuberculosis]|uniref:phage late control D family protein n=1 Tax=Yersinia pseudotuberculosis complex TaxID=1649845 RepID=UPI00061C1F98|nr:MULTISPECIES: phage protein D [Yersinia pseudotuberculosis complex]BCU88731.1 hypothetical protein YP72344_02260 [Yersinia pseudotuberculosis]CNC37190.1 gene D protein [Yersinia similis]